MSLCNLTVCCYHVYVFLVQLHSLLLRHLTTTGMALVHVATSITPGVSVPLSPYFNHTLFQSASCVGTKLYDIVRIVRTH